MVLDVSKLKRYNTEGQGLNKKKLIDKSVILLVLSLICLHFILPFKSLTTEIMIYALGAMGVNLLLGYTGMLSFAQCSLFGVSSYCAGYFLIHVGTHPLLAVLIGSISGSVLAIIIGFFAIRKRGTYFALLTIAIAAVIFQVAFQVKSITGGDDGMLGVPRENIAILPGLELNIQGYTNFFFFVLVMFTFCYILFRRIISSPFGHVLMAIRENQDRAEAIGYNAKYYKLWAFCASGFIAGIAGALYALLMRLVPITVVDLTTSDEFVLMSLIGGLGYMYGPITGAVIVKVITEIFSRVMQRWMLIVGLMFIGAVMYMKKGVWGIILDSRHKGRKK